MEVVPIDEFKPEDWFKTEKLRQMAIERATLEFTSKAFGGNLVEEP